MLSTQCKPKESDKDDSDTATMRATYKKRWLWIFENDVRHYVFFVGAEKKVGDNQCWYEAISKPGDSRRQPEMLDAMSKSFASGYINVPSAKVLVEKEILRLQSLPIIDNIQVTRLSVGIKTMWEDRKSSLGRKFGVLGGTDSKDFKMFKSEAQAKEYVESIKSVFEIAKSSINLNDPCPAAKSLQDYD
jgi:hypothetical protein